MQYSIKQFIATNINSSFNVIDDLPFTTTQKTIAKNTIITKLNDIEKQAYFLVKGIVKISMYVNGEERILEFFFQILFSRPIPLLFRNCHLM
jgi:hypothetical protein